MGNGRVGELPTGLGVKYGFGSKVGSEGVSFKLLKELFINRS